MLRLAGIVLPKHKHIGIALKSIFGIGKYRALEICKKAGLSPSTKVEDIQDSIANHLQKLVEDFDVEGDLRRIKAMAIKRLQDIKCYRGIRHRRGLPVRGQNTKNNARTRKGRKKGKGSSGKK